MTQRMDSVRGSGFGGTALGSGGPGPEDVPIADLLERYATANTVAPRSDLAARIGAAIAAAPAPTPPRRYLWAVMGLDVRGAMRSFHAMLTAVTRPGPARAVVRAQSLALILVTLMAVGGLVAAGATGVAQLVRQSGPGPGPNVPLVPQPSALNGLLSPSRLPTASPGQPTVLPTAPGPDATTVVVPASGDPGATNPPLGQGTDAPPTDGGNGPNATPDQPGATPEATPLRPRPTQHDGGTPSPVPTARPTPDPTETPEATDTPPPTARPTAAPTARPTQAPGTHEPEKTDPPETQEPQQTEKTGPPETQEPDPTDPPESGTGGSGPATVALDLLGVLAAWLVW